MKKRTLLLITSIIVFLSIFLTPSYAYGYFSSLQKQDIIELKTGEWQFGIPNFIQYIFKEYHYDDFLNTGIWRQSEEGFSSGYGLMFIENPYESYEITLIAQLGVGEESNGVAGGFGLLFETSLNDRLQDTGYVLQFDRGYGGILIRPRSDGGESRPLIIVSNDENSFIPKSKRDAFWTEEKKLVLRVTRAEDSETQVIINLWIDDILVIDNLELESNPTNGTLYTGLRSWNTKTEYRILEIREIS